MQVANNHVQRVSLAARRAVEAKDWTQVRACAREILNQQRNSAEGRFLLGLAEKVSNRREQAIKAFLTAISLDDTRYDAAVELADQYLHLNRYGDAVELLQQYAPLMDNSPLYLDRAATIYTQVGLPDKAWPLYKKANELQPGIDSLRAHMAACNVHVGKIDAAKEIYADLLKKHPDHQRNHYELSRLGRATDTAHVEQMKEVLQRKKLKPELNIFLYYAIGKELEDLEQWDEAFEYYKMAGDAARSVADYDVEADIRLIDKIIEVCNKSWLADGTVEGGADGVGKTPVFIVGLPRSGTTLTERILSSHSRVESIGESFSMQIALKRESGVRTTDSMSPAIIESAAKKDIGRIADGYLEAIKYKLGNKPLFIEKHPENVFYLGFIAKAYPQAPIILLKRNPMDNCFAMYKQSYFRYAYSFDDLGPFFVAYNRLYEHWHELLAGRLIEIEYEALVSDQEGETRKLLEQLGLDFEVACLNFEQNKTASNTASNVQIREKVHARSVHRWTCFDKQLQPLRSYLENAGIKVA
ncbi:MAG: sulfotransferase [Proteobacteria bacterium]|nr:sulfotransferase [Pseudomonadota bacterium]